MSSRVRPVLCTSALVPLAIVLSAFGSAPLAAQDDAGTTDASEPEDAAAPSAPPARTVIDLSVTVPKDEEDVVAAEVCEERNEGARVANEIIVCRDLGEATDGVFNKEDWEKRYAERTKLKNGTRAPDFIADCKDQGMPFGCVGLGGVPPPAYMIDFDSLPDTPEGSNADRIARGLPPLNERELTEEQEKARREALGLKPPAEPLSGPE